MFLSCCLVFQLMFLCSANSYIIVHWLLKKILWLLENFFHQNYIFFFFSNTAASLKIATEEEYNVGVFSSQLSLAFKICCTQNINWGAGTENHSHDTENIRTYVAAEHSWGWIKGACEEDHLRKERIILFLHSSRHFLQLPEKAVSYPRVMNISLYGYMSKHLTHSLWYEYFALHLSFFSDSFERGWLCRWGSFMEWHNLLMTFWSAS